MGIIITQGFLKGNLTSHKHTAILKDTWTMAQDTQVKLEVFANSTLHYDRTNTRLLKRRRTAFCQLKKA
ncbi:MAG TPA: hypothetical protein VE076_09365 [Nitrososphaeraceae archaeon]|nr:hypothetical protein [Nitrososphaeraceae archaeon]